MSVSRTSRISAILSAGAAAIAVAIVACPGHQSSKSSKPALLSLAVTPANPALELGETLQFTATGTYSNGTTTDLTALANWTSSNAAAGDVSNAAGSRGLATGLGA